LPGSSTWFDKDFRSPDENHLFEMKVPVGTRLDRYEIRSCLGAGGMGEVYLAQDTRLRRPVALKLLTTESTGNEDRLRRFKQEALVASTLNHPNIAHIYEVGEANGATFIAMEYVEGQTLLQHLTSAPMNLSEVLNIAIQLASALGAAHAAGIVHRDIKPENVMVRPDGYVKVLDFGVAKLVEPQAADVEAATLFQTEPGLVIGTVSYMSPEQARGLPVDARTDIWSLGCVLYWMVAGCAPFQGSTPMDVIVSILEKDPAPLQRSLTGFSVELEQIIIRSLAKDREHRYQTIDELALDLKSVKKELELRSSLERSVPRGSVREAVTSRNWDQKRSAVENLPAGDDTAPDRLCNLPGQLTPFIGRKEEVRDLQQLLRRKDVRLLTLTGPGGTGKTRLSLQVAMNSLDAFADGVFCIELASISNPKLAVSATARTLGIKETGDTPLIESLKHSLRDKQMLLLFDNFEQVLVTAPFVSELLTACHKLKALVTTRAALRVQGEREFPVQPLALPRPSDPASPDALSTYAAVELFVKRAQAVKPYFALTAENARAVADICIRLDGLPLAIELAAARIKLLSPQAMLVRLEHRLKLLTGGARDLPDRQQTMRGAIAWGYDLLGEKQRVFFSRLAVFAGGFTLEAAEALLRNNDEQYVDVLDKVEALVDNSLLQQRDHADGEPRFNMLETIREYGLEQLDVSGEASLIRRQHAYYFLTLAERAELELSGTNQETWLAQLETEHDNLRAAMHWSKASKESEIGLRLAGALWRFWLVRGHLSEGRERLADILTAAENSGSTAALAKVLTGAGTLAHNQGDYTAARSWYEQSLTVWEEVGDKAGVAEALNNLGWVAWRQSDYVAARALSEKSLALHQELGDKKGVAHSLNNLGWVAHFQGDYAEARSFHERSLILRQELGDKRGIAFTLNSLGWAAYKQGDDEQAEKLLMKAIGLLRHVGDKQLIAFASTVLSDVVQNQGDWQRALALLDESVAIFRQIGDKWGIAFSLRIRANVLREQGDYEQAESALRESLTLCEQTGERHGFIESLNGLAEIAIARDQPVRATQLYGAAETRRESIGVHLSPLEQSKYDHNLQSARAELGEALFAETWAKGKAMTQDQTLKYGLDSIFDPQSIQ
jgi:predicted ATPase/serine/threonine protein kinase